jgi:hypothetical protein
MAERGDRRRRFAVYVVAIIAAAATIATSPPQVQSRVQSSSNATVHLDAASPRAVGRFVLKLSPEVLPQETPSGPRPSGTVGFTPDTRNAGVVTTGASNPVLISVSAVGIADPPKVDGSASSWPIEDLCRLAEPCRREFEVTAEWLRPQQGRTIDVPIAANLSILYDRWESPPPGATASWEAGEFVAAAASPTLPASLDLGTVTLGRDAPMAARHVELTASAETLSDPSRTDLTAYVSAHIGAAPLQATTVTLVPDPAPGDDPSQLPRPSAVPADTFVAPFTGCAKGRECTRGFTVFAQWTGIEPAATVDVDWSFEAVARFPGADHVPERATLTAKIDETVDLNAGSPRLTARAEGSFDLGEPNQGRRRGSVRLQVDGPRFDDTYLGVPPPAVATIHVRATVKDPSQPANLVLWATGPGRPGVSSVPVPDGGGEVTAVLFPLTQCARLDLCNGYLEITVESTTAREATISWGVKADLPAPGTSPPSGPLSIAVREAR